MKPNTYYSHYIDNLVDDIISIQSCLNMEPDPIENPDGTYLSDTDYWASHAYEHLTAMYEHLTKLQELKGELIELAKAGKFEELTTALEKL